MKYYLSILLLSYPIQHVNAQEPEELSRLRSQYSSAVSRAVDPIRKKYDERLEALEAELTRSGKSADGLYVEKERLRLKSESDISTVATSTARNEDSPVAAGNVGTEFKDLHGVWTTGEGRTFEFSSARKVLFTYTYATSGGGSTSTTSTYDAKVVDGKIMIERKQSSSSSRSWYEIKIPFSLDNPEVTSHTVYSEETSTSTFKLGRAEQVE